MHETIDILDRDKFITLLYQLISTMSDHRTGKMFAIDGTWGYGKTFVLEKLEKRLSDEINEMTYDNKFYVFHYNCWKYDYYEEPSVAIISAMLETSVNSVNGRIASTVRTSWESAKQILQSIAGEYIKNKIGVNFVEIFQEEKTHNNEETFEFDNLFAFKKTLDATRTNLKKLAEEKTIVIVVDELDRCMPEYAIKVLERLHHLFEGIPNIVVIMAIDSKQLETSIKRIFGDAVDTDRYLRKFISFNLKLSVGTIQSEFKTKFKSYFEKFDDTNEVIDEILKLSEVCKIDIRNLEKLVDKLEIIHSLVYHNTKAPASVLWFETIWGMIKCKISLPDKKGNYCNIKDNLYWLPIIDTALLGDLDEFLPKDAVDYLKQKKRDAIIQNKKNGFVKVSTDFNGEAWYILDQLFADEKTLSIDSNVHSSPAEMCKRFIDYAEIMW